MILPVLLGKLGHPLVELDLHLFDLADQLVIEDFGYGVEHIGRPFQAQGLLVACFRLHPYRFRIHHLGVQLRKLLGRHLFGVAGKIGDNAVLFLVPEEGLLGRVHLLPFHFDPLVEPLYRILDGLELDLQVLVDIRTGKGIDDPGGQHRVFGLKAEVQETGVADGGDLYPADKIGNQL